MVGIPEDPASGSGVNAVATLCDVSTRTFLLVTASCVGLWWACGDGSAPTLKPRTFLMGFSAIPPRVDSTADVIAAINNWAPHADAAIMHVSPPWAAMLGGATPDSAVRTVELPLASELLSWQGARARVHGGRDRRTEPRRRSAGARQRGPQHHRHDGPTAVSRVGVCSRKQDPAR